MLHVWPLQILLHDSPVNCVIYATCDGGLRPVDNAVAPNRLLQLPYKEDECSPVFHLAHFHAFSRLARSQIHLTPDFHI